MNNHDDSFESVRRDRLRTLLDLVANDFKTYCRDYDPELNPRSLPEDKRAAHTTARIRLNDTLHEIHKHLEADWGVYDAERLYPERSLSNGDDHEDYAAILGI